MEGLIQGVGTVAEKDRQSVTRAGGRVAQTVHDVEFRPATTQIDERGSLVEVLTIGEGSLESPVVHVYRATVRLGRPSAPERPSLLHERYGEGRPLRRARGLSDGRRHRRALRRE
jgi:hypothetical protein